MWAVRFFTLFLVLPDDQYWIPEFYTHFQCNYYACLCIVFVGGPLSVERDDLISSVHCSLTPVYMILIGVLASLVIYTGDGPFWPYTDPTAGFSLSLYDACKVNWWTNLLYVNNIVYADNQVACFFVPVCTAVLHYYTCAVSEKIFTAVR